VILFAEVPGFYAEVERAANPALRDRPVIVGGDPRKRGLVQAATADAMAAGVLDGMPVLEALERCPRARALRTDMARYREMSKRLRVCLARFGERIESSGLGAGFLDWDRPGTEVGRSLRELVWQELRLPLRVGIAPVKFLARLAAEESGPQGERVVRPDEVAGFLRPLPVARLPGVGPNTEARLAELGARTIGDVVALGRGPIERALGNHGLAILANALGQGQDRVRRARHPQTLSQESTRPQVELDRGVLLEHLRGIADRLERMLSLEGLVARRLVLKVRYADGDQATRSRALQQGLGTSVELVDLGQELLARTEAGSRPVRMLGLAATRLLRAERDERQLSLFPGHS
jgi:DNA polymerase-4